MNQPKKPTVKSYMSQLKKVPHGHHNEKYWDNLRKVAQSAIDQTRKK